MPIPQPYTDLAGAAQFLRVDARSVRNYIARGDLPAARIRGSRLIRIKIADLEALLRPVPSARSGGDAA